MNDFKTITKINKLIVPALIVIICIIGVNIFLNFEKFNIILTNIEEFNFKWIFESLLYASYNLIILIPVLANLKKSVKSKKQIFSISIFTGVILFIMSIIMFLLLANIEDELENIEMPAIYAIEKNFLYFRYLYGVTILIAIFTTAISVGVSFASNISKNKESYSHIVKILCISSIFVSKIGFSNLVEILFPMFGVLGFIQIFFIFLGKSST